MQSQLEMHSELHNSTSPAVKDIKSLNSTRGYTYPGPVLASYMYRNRTVALVVHVQDKGQRLVQVQDLLWHDATNETDINVGMGKFHHVPHYKTIEGEMHNTLQSTNCRFISVDTSMQAW